MYRIGEQVIYGVHGICRVADTEDRVINGKRLVYLVLEPEGQSGARYLVPTHNEAAMRKLTRVLTARELQSLLESPDVRCDCWIRDESQRKQTYRELIVSGDRTALLRMLHTLWKHKAAQAAAGRKCHQCDENFLRDAEKLLIGEVALVMEIPPEEAREYLRRQLNCDE